MFRLKLKCLRETAGLSQRSLANKLNIAQSTVGMWESGKREPDFTKLNEIAKFFNVTTDYLIGDIQQNINYPIKEEKSDNISDSKLFQKYSNLSSESKSKAKEYIAMLEALDKLSSKDNIKEIDKNA